MQSVLSYMYVCIGLRNMIVCPNYEVVGFQTKTVANPYLDSGFPRAFFKSNI